MNTQIQLSRLLAVALIAFPASAQEPSQVLPPDCSKLPRVVLLADAESCALEDFSTKHDKLQSHFKKNVWPFTYSVPLKLLQPAALQDRAARLLGAAPSERVPIVVRGKRPDWLPATAQPVDVDAAPQESGGGGPEALNRVALRCLIGADRGHYEISQGAAAKKGLSSAAVRIIAEASRDPDIFEWDNPYAHSQAATDGSITSRQSKTEALQNIAQWLTRLSGGVRTACKAHRPADAAYYIGYLLHAAQDLATHQGITNPEHSYLARYDKNPDADATALVLADDWSLLTLGAVAAADQQCWRELQQLKTDTVTVRGDFGPKDGTSIALVKYWQLGSRYKAASVGAPRINRWFNVTSTTEANAFFKNHFLAHVNP